VSSDSNFPRWEPEVSIKVKGAHLPFLLGALRFRKLFAEEDELKAINEMEKKLEWTAGVAAANQRKMQKYVAQRQG
jgi:hypothetical protein